MAKSPFKMPHKPKTWFKPTDPLPRDQMGKFLKRRSRDRRLARLDVEIQWFDRQVSAGIHKTQKQRIGIAGSMLRRAIVANISIPVRRRRRGGRVWVDPKSRSKPGQFPRTDTGRLKKDIFVKKLNKGYTARVGTTLGYGLRLETKGKRSFIRRTYKEIRPELTLVLTKQGNMMRGITDIFPGLG